MRKHSSRMHTTHLPMVCVLVAATRCQYWWSIGIHSLWEGWWVYTKLLADLIPWSFWFIQTLCFLPCLYCFYFLDTFSHSLRCEQPNLLIFVSWVSVMTCVTWFWRCRLWCLFGRGSSGLILFLFGRHSIWAVSKWHRSKSTTCRWNKAAWETSWIDRTRKKGMKPTCVTSLIFLRIV